MNAYRAKNTLWVFIVLAGVLIVLSGCSSAPKKVAQKPQYCHTSQTIKTQNGERVNSETLVECTDDQFKRLTSVKMGLSDHCGIAYRTINVGGKLVEYEIPSCQILDRRGNVIGWEYVKQ
jgi:uncharacterized protein YceK